MLNLCYFNSSYIFPCLQSGAALTCRSMQGCAIISFMVTGMYEFQWRTIHSVRSAFNVQLCSFPNRLRHQRSTAQPHHRRRVPKPTQWRRSSSVVNESDVDEHDGASYLQSLMLAPECHTRLRGMRTCYNSNLYSSFSIHAYSSKLHPHSEIIEAKQCVETGVAV